MRWERQHRQAFLGGEACTCEALPPHRLPEDLELLSTRGTHEHVECLGRRDAHLIHGDRTDVIPVGVDHRHFETRNPQVEVAHGTSVYEA